MYRTTLIGGNIKVIMVNNTLLFLVENFRVRLLLFLVENFRVRLLLFLVVNFRVRGQIIIIF
jgi:hypothetical protein